MSPLDYVPPVPAAVVETPAPDAVPRMAWGCLKCGTINNVVGQLNCAGCGTPYAHPATEEPKP